MRVLPVYAALALAVDCWSVHSGKGLGTGSHRAFLAGVRSWVPHALPHRD